jgi:hypothetical protein
MLSLTVAAVSPYETGVARGMNTGICTVHGASGPALMTSVVTADLDPADLPVEGLVPHGFAMLGGALVVVLLVPGAAVHERSAARGKGPVRGRGQQRRRVKGHSPDRRSPMNVRIRRRSRNE